MGTANPGSSFVIRNASFPEDRNTTSSRMRPVAKTTVPRRRLRTHEPTHYVNVDLDILSAAALTGLVQAMGDNVSVLYVGGESRQFEAHLELASPRLSTTPDRAIVGFVKLIDRLPPRHRETWDRARSRELQHRDRNGFGASGVRVAPPATHDRGDHRGASHVSCDRLRARFASRKHLAAEASARWLATACAR